MMLTPRASFALRAGVLGASVLVALTAGLVVDRESAPATQAPASALVSQSPQASPRAPSPTSSPSSSSPLPSVTPSPRAVPGLGQVLAVVDLEDGEGACGGAEGAIDEGTARRLGAGLPGLELVGTGGCVTGARLPVEANQVAVLRVEVDRAEATVSLVVADVRTPGVVT